MVIFASNIFRNGFINDVFSETEKFIAHNNYPIIYTNIGINTFDVFLANKILSYKPKIIKLPVVDEILSLPTFEYYFKHFLI